MWFWNKSQKAYPPVKVVDLAPEYEHTYFNCLEEEQPDMQDAGELKSCWSANIRSGG